MDTLYIGQLVIVLLFIVLFGMTEIGGSVMQKHEETLQTTIKAKKKTLFSVESYWLEMKDFLSGSNDWESDTLRQIRNILDKIASIPAYKIERNEDVLDEINLKLNQLKELCETYLDADDKETLRRNIDRKVSQVRNYVTMIKTQL